MWRLARSPRWIGGLVLALAIASVFGLLGQWQISRAVATASHEGPDTETVVPLTSIATPQTPATALQNGRMVMIEGGWVPGDFGLLGGRRNGGEEGWWVTGHFQTVGGDGLAVAVGWAPTSAAAERAVASAEATAGEDVVTLTGRYLASESPTENDLEAGERRVMAVPELINLWGEVDRVYDGYLVAAAGVGLGGGSGLGLDVIDSPPPEDQVRLNWLNVFYAVEWVVFAVLAFYMWYRLLKDAFERQLEDEEEARAQEAREVADVD